jgi:hypothetical protein
MIQMLLRFKESKDKRCFSFANFPYLTWSLYRLICCFSDSNVSIKKLIGRDN